MDRSARLVWCWPAHLCTFYNVTETASEAARLQSTRFVFILNYVLFIFDLVLLLVVLNILTLWYSKYISSQATRPFAISLVYEWAMCLKQLHHLMVIWSDLLFLVDNELRGESFTRRLAILESNWQRVLHFQFYYHSHYSNANAPRSAG